MARHYKLRCMKCFKRDWMAYEVLKTLPHITWRNISVTYHTKNACKCICANCNHTYLSKSEAAFRKLRATTNNLNPSLP